MKLDLNDSRLLRLKEKFKKEDEQKEVELRQSRKANFIYSADRDLMSDAEIIITRVTDTYNRLHDYRDTVYRNLARPALFWPDGRSLGFGFAAHVFGIAQRFYNTFKYWGSTDLTEFYSLPLEFRNKYLADAAEFWEDVFGKQQGDSLKHTIRQYRAGEIGVEYLRSTLIDKEHILKAGFKLLADLTKEEARDKKGWEASKARKRAEAEFVKPVDFDPVRCSTYFKELVRSYLPQEK